METITAIEKNLAWLATMKQSRGYSGPVVHYWQDCLHYIGPSMNWCYEGLIASFLTLHQKTGQKEFLHRAIEAGNDLLKNQLPNGVFLNSHFEVNPSLGRGSTPHDTAAALGLVYLAKALKEQEMKWQPYLEAAKKNLDKYHLERLYDPSTKLFFQYIYDPQHLHVPNKIATLIQLLIAMASMTNDKRYLDYIQPNADYILELQNKDEMTGGIYQTEKRDRIITFYTARCIPALLEVYNLTKKKKYLEGARAAGKFLVNMRNDGGGYFFGYQKINNEWKLTRYPMFIAGSGDITRSLFLLEGKKTPLIAEDIKFLLDHQLENGSFMTSYGMHLKNQVVEEYKEKPSWRDTLPVVGWNDKALRLCTELMQKGTTIIEPAEVLPINRECRDGAYEEDKTRITIKGKENYVFRKNASFSTCDVVGKMLIKVATKVIASRADRKIDVKILDYLLKRGFTLQGLHRS